MAFAVLVLVQNDLARADRSRLAVAGADLVRSIQIDHVLSARRVMPVEKTALPCDVLPTPAVPAVALSGLALSQAINWAKSATGSSFLTTMICGSKA
jgi:hypothetical protein